VTHVSADRIFELVLHPTFSDFAPFTFLPGMLHLVVQPLILEKPYRIATLLVFVAVFAKRVYFQRNRPGEADLGPALPEAAREVAAAPAVNPQHPVAAHLPASTRNAVAADPQAPERHWLEQRLRKSLGRVIDQQYLVGIELHDYEQQQQQQQ
jgi:hypothetical protein